MAKKNAGKARQVREQKATRPVRLELSAADHDRLERCAVERGLSKASYARQAVLERIKADEAKQ